MLKVIALTVAVGLVLGQQIGTLTQEYHPSMSVQQCTKSGGCVTQ